MEEYKQYLYGYARKYNIKLRDQDSKAPSLSIYSRTPVMFQSQAQTEPEARVLKFTNAFKKKNTQLDRPNGGIWIYMQGRNNHDVEDKKRKK